MSGYFVIPTCANNHAYSNVLTRGQRRLTAMGRDLRPAGSWSTPFRPARLMVPGALTWFGIWFGGLLHC